MYPRVGVVDPGNAGWVTTDRVCFLIVGVVDRPTESLHFAVAQNVRLLSFVAYASILDVKMSWFRFYSDMSHDDDHPAGQIVFNWQKDYSKAWKWNDAHRHISKDPRVPLWDDGSCMSSYIVPKLPFLIPLGFDSQQRLSIYRIRLIRYNIRERERLRLQRKKVWWRRFVEFKDKYFKEYHHYRYNSMVPQVWLALAMKRGLTFRHLRSHGYRPYINESEDLEEELISIDSAVRSEMDFSMHIYVLSPYIIL